MGLSFVLLLAAGATARSDDRALMAAVAAGDREAFMEVYRKHSPAVLGVLCRMLRDRAAAEDLLQETFLALWERRTAWKAATVSALPWLFVVARHRALDRIRSAAHRHETAAEDLEAWTPTHLQPDFEAQVWQALDLARARAALAALQEHEQECLELAYFEGMTQTEISQRLHEPLGTIKSRMRTGMAKLKQALTGEGIRP